MRILFPYLARWHSANRSRYHQLLTQLCHLGHQVFVLQAPTMALNDISATDISDESRLPEGMELSELYAPLALRSFWRMRISKTKLLKKGLLSLTSISQVRRFVEKERIDVLLVYNLPQAPLLRRVNCRTHFDLADDLVAMMGLEQGLIARAGGTSVARAIQNRMLAQADTVTVASSVLAEQMNRPVLMLPNGADVKELDQTDSREWRSRKLGPTAGFVGAFEYWVDFDLVFQIAQRLPHLSFLLVGGGRRLEQVKRQVERMGLTNVHLTGALPYSQAMNYVAGMDVCLLPFTHDAVSDGSCPLKLFEYAALRKPIVSTSTREAMRIGNGWMDFANDAVGFADAIESLLRDPNRAVRAVDAGRALVEQIYNWPHLAGQFAALLSNGTAEVRAGGGKTHFARNSQLVSD